MTSLVSARGCPHSAPHSQFPFLLFLLHHKHTTAVLITVRRRQPPPPRKPYIVVLVSSGDHVHAYSETANEIATRLKYSGIFEQVFFNGWCDSSLESSERLREAVESCTAALLISTPFGHHSYGEFLERKQLSTWRDAFVLGSFAFVGEKRGRQRRTPKLYVAYFSDSGGGGGGGGEKEDATTTAAEEEVAEEAACGLHDDFVSHVKRCYDVSRESELRSLLSVLLDK